MRLDLKKRIALFAFLAAALFVLVGAGVDVDHVNKVVTLALGKDAGPDTNHRNLLINGDFYVAQRGTSFSAITGGSMHMDRWWYSETGSMVHTVSRSTDVPTVAESGRLIPSSCLVDCTTLDSSIGASEVTFIAQRVEGPRWAKFAQRQLTMSFWVKATKTGTYCVFLRNNLAATPDRSYVAEYTVNNANTWEAKTIAISASPSAGTWNYAEGVAGVEVGFTLAAGSTFHGTNLTWNSANVIATANQVNATDSTSNDFRVCGVQIEPGPVATMYESRSFEQELYDCMRFYERWDSTQRPVLGAVGHCASTTQAWGSVTYSVVKCKAPSFTFSGTASNFLIQFGGGSGGASSTPTTVNSIGKSTATLQFTVAAGLTLGQGCEFLLQSDAVIQLGAEI